MPTRWTDNKGDPRPGPILADLEDTFRKHQELPTGDPSLHDYVISLLSCIEFGISLPEYEQIILVQDALARTFKKKTLEPKGLLTEISKLETEYTRRPLQSYVLATSVSTRYFNGLGRTSISGSTITFSRYLPYRFKAKSVVEKAKHVIHGGIPNTYASVRVKVSAQSIYDALDKAMDALDLLRGIWSIHLNRSKIMIITSGKRRQFNDIVSGPIYSLHHPSGKLAWENYMFDPTYVEPISVQSLESHWAKLKKSEAWFRKRLKTSSARDYIENAIRRYVRALDTSDHHKSFLELWGLLEMLTCTQRTTYEDTIRRASFIWANPQYHREQLRHLRMRRNQSVHSGKNSMEGMPLLCQIKRYVEQLIVVFLVQSQHLESLEEFGQFLDSPTDKSAMHRRKYLINRVIKFHKA